MGGAHERVRIVSALKHLAAATRAAGRGPDKHLVHLSDRELQLLHRSWGPPDINPRTGLPEYGWFDSVLSSLLPIAGAAFPGVGSEIGSFLGAEGAWSPILGNAILGGGAGLLTSGGDWRRGLLGAGIGGVSAAAMPYIANELAGTGLGNFLGIQGGHNTITGRPDTPSFDQVFGMSDPSSRMASYASDPAFQPTGVGGIATSAPGVAASASGAGGRGASGGGGSSWLKYALPAVTLAGILSSSGRSGQPGAPPPPQSSGGGGGGALPKLTLNMRPKDTTGIDWWTYGQRPKQSTSFFDPQFTREDGTPMAARGGYVQEFARGGPPMPRPGNPGALASIAPPVNQSSRYVGPGPGSGRQDQIPARLSPNEYVVDAETVSMLGDGSPDEGARRLDKMRKGVRQHKGRVLAKGKFSPNAKPPERYMGGRT